MRVGFDCSPLVVPHSAGIARVVQASLRALEARENLTAVRLQPAPGENLRRWRQNSLPKQVESQGLVGLHTFQAAFPLRLRAKRVQTVHELSWRHGVRETGTWRRMAWVHWGKRHADAIVTATEFTAMDLRKKLGSQAHKLRVIPWAGATEWQHSDSESDLQTLAQLKLDGVPFVLSPGGLRSKKRPRLLVDAVERLRAGDFPALQVVFTHDPTHGDPPRFLKEHRQSARVLDHVPDPLLACLYRQAQAAVVLSKSEGFSLPVLESMGAGTPVVVRAQSAQAEVAGSLGLPAHGETSDGAADAMARALRGEHASPADLRAHAGRYSWQETARRIETLWEELA